MENEVLKIESGESQDPRPSWLKNLAVESWQPELVISGAIIIGSTYIPSLVTEAFIYFSLTGNSLVQILIGLVRIYLLIGAFSITINFVIHFVLRTLWVGLIGLVSVYPKGIKRENLKFSESFKTSLLDEFGSIDDYILNLDRVCSVIFAFASNVVLVFVSISWGIAWTFFVFYLLMLIIPDPWVEGWEQIAYFCFLGLIFLPSMLSAVLTHKVFHERKWAQKIHYPLYINYGKLMFSIFWKPINFIQTIFSTNLKQERFLGFIIAYMLFIAFCASFYMGRQGNYSMLGGQVPIGNVDANYLKPEHYQSMSDPDQFVVYPYIESDQFESGEAINGFIPLYRREQNKFSDLFGERDTSADSLDVYRFNNQRAYLIDCAKQFYTFKLDDRLIEPELIYHRHPEKYEKGFRFRISSENLPEGDLIEGKHILSIQKKNILIKPDPIDLLPTVIPFWVE